MKPIKVFCFVLQLLVLVCDAKAQLIESTKQKASKYYILKTYGINDGIPSKSTTSAIKDKRGFIWVGTENGLCKFDGYSFKTYANVLGDSTSLSNNYINAIVEDSKGFFWVGTMNGLNKFDPVTEKFERFYHKENNKRSLSNDKVWSILLDRANKLWVGTDDGFNLLNKDLKSFTTYQPDAKNPNAIKGKSVNAIAEDKQGNLWLGNWNKSLNKFDKTTQRFINYKQNEAQRQKNPNDIWTLCIDDEGIIWIGSYWKGDLFRFDPKSEKFTTYASPSTTNTAIYSVLSLGANKLLVGGNAGFFG